MNNAIINLIIIGVTVVVVATVGLTIFLWWRTQYGVLAKGRQTGQTTRSHGGQVVGDDWSVGAAPNHPGGGGESDGPTAEQRRVFLAGMAVTAGGVAIGSALAADSHHQSGQGNDAQRRSKANQSESTNADWQPLQGDLTGYLQSKSGSTHSSHSSHGSGTSNTGSSGVSAGGASDGGGGGGDGGGGGGGGGD